MNGELVETLKSPNEKIAHAWSGDSVQTCRMHHLFSFMKAFHLILFSNDCCSAVMSHVLSFGEYMNVYVHIFVLFLLVFTFGV